MDARQLRLFVAIVEHGGFTKAAAAVHLAQPSMSLAIRGLEVELGTDLFDRVGRSVRLTAAGHALLEPARQVIRDVETARAAVSAVVGLVGGHLDVVCLPTLALSPVAALVGTFRREHPDVTVRLAEPEDFGQVSGLVRSGRAEIGFTELPRTTARGAYDGLVEVELSTQEYVAVVPRGWSSARSTTMSVLSRWPLITTQEGTSTRRLIDEAFSQANVVPRIAVETDHREVIAEMVRSGAGYSILPKSVVDHMAGPGERVLWIRPRITRRVGLIHRSTTLSPAARAFLAIVNDRRVDGTTSEPSATSSAANRRAKPS